MKRLVTVSVILIMLISGCAGKPAPCPENPPLGVVEDPTVYRPGYTVLAYNRPGLVGKVAAAPGHVLTTEPSQDYYQLDLSLDAKRKEDALNLQREMDAKFKAVEAEKRKTQDRIKLPRKFDLKPVAPVRKVVVTPKDDPWKRAWKRYCENGVGLTDQDIKILETANYVIPDEFMKSCLPPK